MGELKDSTHTVWTGADGNHILGVFNSANDAGGENELLPGFADVEDVDSIVAAPPDVFRHGIVRVPGSSVDFCREHHRDVLLPILREVFHGVHRIRTRHHDDEC